MANPDGIRSFLERVLANGLDEGTVLPADVVRHADPQVLAHHLPVELRAKLLAASLSAQAMNPDLVVTTVGTMALSQHVPPNLLWACLADCATRALGDDKSAPAPRQAKAEPAKAEPAKAEPAKSPGPGLKPPGGMLPSKTPPVGTPVPQRTESTKTDIKQIDEPQPKPNAKAKGEPPAPSRAEPSRAPTAKPLGKTDARGGPPPPVDAKAAARMAPIIPKSEFEVDTDVGEWGADDIVDIVEEAEAVGAVVDESSPDWKADEETVNRFKRK